MSIAQIALAWVLTRPGVGGAIVGEEEATLKKLYREKQNGESVYRLQPANEKLEPIYVDSLEIRGVVVGVVRRY